MDESEKLSFEYVPLSASIDHINRHFAGSTQPGSKFLPMSDRLRDEIIGEVDNRLQEEFIRQTSTGNAPERVVLKVKFSCLVGTDALIELTPELMDRAKQITRDIGTEFETAVKVVEDSDIPMVDEITVIAGRYGPSNKWGIYTMFPGREAPPFPNPNRQTPDAVESNKAFWSNHGFLATPEEIRSIGMPK